MHLRDDQIIAVLKGSGPSEDRRHLATCERCSLTAQTWRDHLPDLTALAAETVDTSELHQLTTLFRHYRTEEPQRSWIGAILDPRTGLVAVRGTSSNMIEVEAGPFHIALQTSPVARRSAVTLHGQITADESADLGTGTLVLAASSGEARVVDVNSFGEFHLEGLAHGHYSATWYLASDKIRLDDLAIGEHDES